MTTVVGVIMLSLEPSVIMLSLEPIVFLVGGVYAATAYGGMVGVLRR